MTASEIARIARLIRRWLRDDNGDGVPIADRAPVYTLIRQAIRSHRNGKDDASLGITIAALRAGAIESRHFARRTARAIGGAP